MFKTLRNKKGVTLIELLAVVVILGIIAAIAVPTIGGLIARQEERAAKATWDAIESAAQLYADDEALVFSLSELDPDWIDLKSNEFSFVAGDANLEDAEDVFISVSASGVVTVVSVVDEAADPLVVDEPITFYINGHVVYTPTP